MRRPVLFAGAVTLALAVAYAAPARAYQRSCDPDTGRCFWWPTDSVSWKLDPAGRVAPSCTTAVIEAAAVAGFSAWQDASRGGERCASLKLPFAGLSASTAIGHATTGEHLVVLRGGWCSVVVPAGHACRAAGDCNAVFNCFDDGGGLDQNILALTTVFYLQSTGRIVDADVEVVGWDGTGGTIGGLSNNGWYFTCVDPTPAVPTCTTYGQAGCISRDLQNVLTHEAGHFLGLAHVCGPDVGIPCTLSLEDRTMFPSTTARDISRRTLAPDDVNGVCDTYPAFTPGPPGGPFEGGAALQTGVSGCGAGAAGPLGLLLAAAGFLPYVARVRYNRRAWRSRRPSSSSTTRRPSSTP